VRSMAFQSTTKFLLGSRWVLEFLLFIADQFRDLSLQELESPEVTESGTIDLPLAPIRVGLISDAQLRHGSTMLGEAGLDPSRVKPDHNQAGSPAATDPIDQSPSDSNFEGDREVFRVG
jgi:hypothetical protein